MTDEKRTALALLHSLSDDVKQRQMIPMKEEEASSDLSGIVNYLETDKAPKDWGARKRCQNEHFVFSRR